MKNMIHVSFSYLKYYKKQTAALLVGVILSTALLTGMGGLLESGTHAALEHAREEYGDWHYSMRVDDGRIRNVLEASAGNGYHIEKAGVEIIRKVIEEPFAMEFVYADSGYLDMMGRRLAEGHYPERENEVSMDGQTLLNLGYKLELGTQVALDGETFTLCGIMEDMPEKLPEYIGDIRQVFVSSTLDYKKNGRFLYLKFDENRKIYKELKKFCKEFDFPYDNIARNNGLAGYVGGEDSSKVWETVKTGLSHKEAGLPYIWGSLNAEGKLTESAIFLALALFGAFVIYNLFQVSVTQRMSQYSVMQTLGMTEGYNIGILLFELFSVGLAGYPVGCVLGNVAAWFIYRKAGRIFITQNQTRHTGEEEPWRYGVSNLPDAGNYHISKQAVLWGFVCMVFVIVLISILLIRRMRKQSIRQMLVKEVAKHPKRKIHSIRHSSLTGILTHRFMFSRKGAFVGIVLSLSVGSIIFLGAFYFTENTKRDNDLTFKADDGLGSDIEVYIQSDRLTDSISEETIEKMKKISGIKNLYPVSYSLGELALDDGALRWPQYFAELADDEANPPDEKMQEKYNGIAVKTGQDDYALKVNIYGYDDAMLEDMNDYLLEGEINPDQMRKENSIIVKTLMDGQGNYDGIAVKSGDEITLKTVKSPKLPQKALRFSGGGGWYQNNRLKVTALASRPMAKVDTYIGDDGETAVDIIMTNEQMEQNFGVKGFQTVSISVRQRADVKEISSKIAAVAKNVRKCVVKDYSGQIQAQNLYLAQKMFFYYGIAAVLLGISLLHIMNSMKYLIAARSHEFAILRAMGITNSGFYRMIAREGLRYGIYSGLTVTVIYLAVQKILYYFMVHVYMYLDPQSFITWQAIVGVVLLNILLCVVVTLIAGRMVLKRQVAEEIKE